MDLNYTTTFTVDQSPAQVFAAVTNPRGWWSQEIKGDTDRLGGEFTYRNQDVHRTSFKITEFVPDTKVVWHVVDNYFKDINDKTEWIGTNIVFEITPKGDQTELRFTHVGLVPDYECYDNCSTAWRMYVNHSLRNLITTGKGQPNPIEEEEPKQMSGQDYSTTFTVDNTPAEVFAAINNVRGWWSEQVDGHTDRPGSVFNYHYQDVHRATFKITEFVPNEKVVWHIVDNYFNFTKDKTEWKDTDIVFEIISKGDKTELRFTHIGLVPDYECYEVCTNAWGSYVSSSLRNLITTGKGQPNPIEEVVNQAREMSEKNYSTSFTVDQSPDDVFAAVNNVRGWWIEAIDGDTDQLGAAFTVQFADVHRSTQKITELVPGKRVVWQVTDSQLNFVNDKHEWTDTQIIFDIARTNDRTELRFTHVGLSPAVECYGACSNSWGFYINKSLFNLISSGKGDPEKRDAAVEQLIKLDTARE